MSKTPNSGERCPFCSVGAGVLDSDSQACAASTYLTHLADTQPHTENFGQIILVYCSMEQKDTTLNKMSCTSTFWNNTGKLNMEWV